MWCGEFVLWVFLFDVGGCCELIDFGVWVVVGDFEECFVVFCVFVVEVEYVVGFGVDDDVSLCDFFCWLCW